MVQSHLSRLLKYTVRFSRFYDEMALNCTKVTLNSFDVRLLAWLPPERRAARCDRYSSAGRSPLERVSGEASRMRA